MRVSLESVVTPSDNPVSVGQTAASAVDNSAVRLSIESQQTSDAEDLCCICLEHMESPNRAQMKHCTHAMHVHCALQWVARAGLSSQCPLCKTSILHAESSASTDAGTAANAPNEANWDEETRREAILQQYVRTMVHNPNALVHVSPMAMLSTTQFLASEAWLHALTEVPIIASAMLWHAHQLRYRRLQEEGQLGAPPFEFVGSDSDSDLDVEAIATRLARRQCCLSGLACCLVNGTCVIELVGALRRSLSGDSPTRSLRSARGSSSFVVSIVLGVTWLVVLLVWLCAASNSIDDTRRFQQTHHVPPNDVLLTRKSLAAGAFVAPSTWLMILWTLLPTLLPLSVPVLALIWRDFVLPDWSLFDMCHNDTRGIRHSWPILAGIVAVGYLLRSLQAVCAAVMIHLSARRVARQVVPFVLQRRQRMLEHQQFTVRQMAVQALRERQALNARSDSVSSNTNLLPVQTAATDSVSELAEHQAV
ncbi:MAG: hypothetical protein MHM6MM_000724 [Cercozoa sp. M6MM]